MGNSSSQESKGTSVSLALNRQVFQAGCQLSGEVIVSIAKQDFQMLSRFGGGGVVEIALGGAESVYWAVDHKHDLNRTTGIKSMI